MPQSTTERFLFLLNEYAAGGSIADISSIANRIRFVSLQGFKLSSEAKRWLARALQLVSCFHRMAASPDTVAAYVTGEANRRSVLFTYERVYFPVFGFLAQRNDGMLPMLNNIRASLKSLHMLLKV
jgi:hypothetical protein